MTTCKSSVYAQFMDDSWIFRTASLCWLPQVLQLLLTILLLALQGKLLTSAPESSHSGASEGQNMLDTTLCCTLSGQGWKGEKHGPAEGNKIMLKGLLGRREGNPNILEK